LNRRSGSTSPANNFRCGRRVDCWLRCSPWRQGRAGRYRQIAAQLLFAAVLAYLLMVMNDQNFWLCPRPDAASW
jgi:hypothetical protein